ncbi:winged helix-turn-helix domain-containing protein [Thermoactinospora rubra]|uniref:DprA-like winged helix domain-containing protein n=1 Tax=Thermoactinospora rubra TaxID=1088767 RepID=UPI00197DAFB3
MADILAALGTDTLSRDELAARTGLSVPALRRWLKIMREEGSIELVGIPKSRHVRYRRAQQDPLFSQTRH